MKTGSSATKMNQAQAVTSEVVEIIPNVWFMLELVLNWESSQALNI